ncbi:MAG: hypothetical protein RL150_639 [Candidatus Parcubacteria bacterium]
MSRLLLPLHLHHLRLYSMQSSTGTTKKVWIAVTVLAVVAVLSIGLSIFVSRQEQEVVVLRDDVERAAREDLVSLKRAIRAFEDERILLDSIIINEDSMFSFIDDLTRLAATQGAQATVENLIVSEIGTDGASYPADTLADAERSHGMLTLTMRVTGSWEEVTTVLLALEQLPRQAHIESARFASVYDAKGAGTGWVALFELAVTLE